MLHLWDFFNRSENVMSKVKREDMIGYVFTLCSPTITKQTGHLPHEFSAVQVSSEDEDVLMLTVGMAAQLQDHPKNRWVIHFQRGIGRHRN